jgi:DNA-directed RNA polymerase subunit RPC12/RpoP
MPSILLNDILGVLLWFSIGGLAMTIAIWLWAIFRGLYFKVRKMSYKCKLCGQRFNTVEAAKCGRCAPKPIPRPMTPIRKELQGASRHEVMTSLHKHKEERRVPRPTPVETKRPEDTPATDFPMTSFANDVPTIETTQHRPWHGSGGTFDGAGASGNWSSSSDSCSSSSSSDSGGGGGCE